MVYLVLLSATLFSIMYVRAILGAASQAGLKPIGIDLLTFKVLVEVVASYFGIGFVFAAIAYLWHEPTAVTRKALSQFPPVGLAVGGMAFTANARVTRRESIQSRGAELRGRQWSRPRVRARRRGREPAGDEA